MSTIADVAAAAGVSTATVSRVLNGKTSVDPNLVARVQAVVDRLGYQPSRVARSLRTRQASVWFLIVSDIHNPFFTDLVRSIEEEAFANDYTLVVCNAASPAREAACLRLALAEQAAGIVLVPTRPGKTDLREVLARGVPVVVVDQRVESAGVDRVVVDNVAATEAAVGHLVANGYERIAFIGGPSEVTTARERLVGYKRGLAGRDRPFDAALARRGNFHESGGREQMQALLALHAPPDAVIVANNTMTVGALRALRDARRRIPRDVGVVGFDETPWASLVEPPLTTVAQPTHELGLESARLLLSRIDGFHGAPREVVLRPELHLRGSSAVRRRR